MKKIREVLGGHKEEPVVTTPTTTTSSIPVETVERKIITEEPIRHESVGGGVKETFRHPVNAFKGEPRDRSPTDVRRKEWTERVPVYREGGREVTETREVSKTMEGLSIEERRAPRNVSEFRQQVSTLPMHTTHHTVATTTTLAPTIIEKEPSVFVEHRERGAVVREHIHQTQVEEIQPIIHREREKTEVVQVAKPVIERDVRPVEVEEKVLPAETRPAIIQGESEEFRRLYRERSQKYQSTTEYAPVEREVIERPPIVKEHITRKVIEEVQPVIYREVTAPHVIKEVKPIYEKIVEGPVFIEGRELPAEERICRDVHQHHEYRTVETLPTTQYYTKTVETVPTTQYYGKPAVSEFKEYVVSKEHERESERLERERLEREAKKTTHGTHTHTTTAPTTYTTAPTTTYTTAPTTTEFKGEPVYEYREVRSERRG
jgi:hypothetical protein